MAESKNIYVYLDWVHIGSPTLIGVLRSELLRGKEVFSFESDKDWLKHNEFRLLDPDLGYFAGTQYLRDEKTNFGLFLDSSPDRWGRMLMRRREAILSKSENRSPRTLTEADYLLGVYDGNRMGALRFKISPDGEFMDDNRELATPPWASIRDLEYASLHIEGDNATSDPEYSKWLGMLIAPGSSLGGARPKANVVDENGVLWIAKFPSGNDTKNVGAWEAVVATLAQNCGIEIAPFKAQKFSNNQHTFCTKRFDREGSDGRIHFASAMTLLGYCDGANSTEGVSYLELAEWIMANCDNADYNLEQLWRRIAFSVAVSNCDDHLRNHGFLLTPRGWTLSPAYDINPDEQGRGLTLNISENDNSLEFDLVLSVAKYFGVKDPKVATILNEVKHAVSAWRKVATAQGISRSEQELVAQAFRY